MYRQSYFCLSDAVAHCNGPHIFHCRVWHRTFSLRYACSWLPSMIIPWATCVPNFVSVAPSTAELAHGEKLCTQSLTHSAYLMPREAKLLLCNKPGDLSSLGSSAQRSLWYSTLYSMCWSLMTDLTPNVLAHHTTDFISIILLPNCTCMPSLTSDGFIISEKLHAENRVWKSSASSSALLWLSWCFLPATQNSLLSASFFTP